MYNQFMRIFFTLLLLILSMSLNSCVSKKEPLAKGEIANVFIQLLDSSSDDKYQVYLNYKDSNRTLDKNSITKFSLGLGEANIQIVKKRKTASIDFVVQKGKNYYFNVFSTMDKELIILQRAKK